LIFCIFALPANAFLLHVFQDTCVTTGFNQARASSNENNYEWEQHGCIPERSSFQQGTAPSSSHVLWKRQFLAILHPPIVVNGKVISAANFRGKSQGSSGFLYALDHNTGELLWTTNMTDPLYSGWSEGNHLIKLNDKHFMYSHGGNFSVYEIETGRLALNFNAGNYLGDGGVYVPEISVWFGVGSFTDTAAQTIEAWDFSELMQPKMLWSSEPLELIDTRSYYENERFHVGSNDFTENCFDANTGELLWQVDMRGFTSFYGCGAFDRIFRGSVNNYLWAIDPSTGKILWEFRTGGYGSFMGGMAAAYDKVYMLNADGYLYALNAYTGSQVWKHRAFEPNNTQPVVMHYPQYGAIADNKVYWLVADRKTHLPIAGLSAFVCLNAETGKELWHSHTAEIRCPAIAYGRLYGSDYIYDRDKFTSDPKIANKIGAYIWCFGKGPTALKVSIEEEQTTHGEKVTISGNLTDLSPASAGAPASNVQITLSWQLQDGTSGAIATIETDTNGTFSCDWIPENVGSYRITASSQGSDAYEAPASSTELLIVKPLLKPYSKLVTDLAGALLGALVIIALVLFIHIRKRKTRTLN
jgi:outer membrane protein assembly factor BamB